MKFIKTLQSSGASLIAALNGELSGFEPARSHKNVHASALTYQEKEFCPREYALLDVTYKQQKDQHVTTAMRVAFDIGEAYHDLIRNKWLRHIAVGKWECTCGYTTPFGKEPKITCPQCHRKHWTYQEMRYHGQDTGVSGSIDLIVDLGLPKLQIVEIKSMDKDQFKGLASPLAEHRIRTVLYMHLVESSNHELKDSLDFNQARVLYVSKGFGVKSEEHKVILPFKEFIVNRSDADITPYLTKAKSLLSFKYYGGFLPPGVCPSGLCPRAKQCSVAAECFSAQYAKAKFTKNDTTGGYDLKEVPHGG